MIVVTATARANGSCECIVLLTGIVVVLIPSQNQCIYFQMANASALDVKFLNLKGLRNENQNLYFPCIYCSDYYTRVHTNTSTPTATFTVTQRATNPPEEHPTNTTTPPFIRYTYSYTPTAMPFCKDDITCNMRLDTDTLLDADLLRIRFWNWGLYTSTLVVSVKIDNAYNLQKGIGVDSETTGELVFNIPCIKEAKEITILIKYPGYTATEVIDYPTCVCQE